MTTKIVIKPSDAAREMTTMSNELQLMLASLTSLNNRYRDINDTTKFPVVSKVLNAAASSNNQLATELKASVHSFCDALAQVINRAAERAGSRASKVTYTDPSYIPVEVQIKQTEDDIDADPQKLTDGATETRKKAKEIDEHFTKMSSLMNGSVSWWIGQNGDKTRETWKSSIEPKAQQVSEWFSKVSKALDDGATFIVDTGTGGVTKG